jgi:hypothetical protein
MGEKHGLNIKGRTQDGDVPEQWLRKAVTRADGKCTVRCFRTVFLTNSEGYQNKVKEQCTWHVSEKNTYGDLVVKPEGDNLKDLGVDGRTIFKLLVSRMGVWTYTTS